METLVVAATLGALVLIDAGHWIAISLVRWSPVVIAGALAGWLAGREGFSPLEALAVGALISVIARVTTRRLRHRSEEDIWC